MLNQRILWSSVFNVCLECKRVDVIIPNCGSVVRTDPTIALF